MAHLVEDDVGCSFPDERSRLLVPLRKPLVDGALQFGDAPKGPSADHALRDQSEPTLDLIEPGAAGRDEMQMESATLLRLEPALHGRTFVGAVVVHDEVNVQLGRYFLFQFAEEFDVLPAPMATQTVPNHLAGQNVEGGKQRGRAVALVVVRLSLRQAWSQGQNGSGPIQGLDLALFVNAKHQSSIRGVEVKSHHVADLSLELRVVGNLKRFHAMRLNIIALPEAVHHHARKAQVSSEPARTPVGGVRRARLQRRIQNPLLQVRGEHPPRPVALLGMVERLAAAAGEGGARRQNGGARQSGLLRNGLVGNPLAGEQNHSTLASYPLRRPTVPNPGLQLLPLIFVEHKSSGAGKHASIKSRCRSIVKN